MEVPDFIVEFYNTTGCDINVYNSYRLMYTTNTSSMEQNKNYQLVGHGNCWTLNEMFLTNNNNIIISDGTHEGNLTINNDNIIV